MKSQIYQNPQEESLAHQDIARRSAGVHPVSGRDMELSPSAMCIAEKHTHTHKEGGCVRFKIIRIWVYKIISVSCISGSNLDKMVIT